MKKIIFGAILGLVSAVSFAQTVQSTPTEKAHHTKEEIQAARESCRASVGKPEDKKAHHKAMIQCMQSKGFKHHKKQHGEKPGTMPVQPMTK